MHLYPIEFIKRYLAETRLYALIQEVANVLFRSEAVYKPIRVVREEVLQHEKINYQGKDPYVS